jgi:hypothetical protein
MKYNEGQYIIIWSMMQIFQISSVRKSGDLITLWVKNKDCEFPISSLEWQNKFVIKSPQNFSNGVSNVESKITKLSSFIPMLILFIVILAYSAM